MHRDRIICKTESYKIACFSKCNLDFHTFLLFSLISDLKTNKKFGKENVILY